MSDEKYQSAAILADNYIEVILSTSPELLIADITTSDEEGVQDAARRLAIFRASLVEELLDQPLVEFGDSDDEEDEEDKDDQEN